MSFQKKPFKQTYLTENDRKRIAAIDSNTFNENRKCKCQITLKHPDISAKICIMTYGKDLEMIKSNAKQYLMFFKEHDAKWKLLKIEDMKKEEK